MKKQDNNKRIILEKVWLNQEEASAYIGIGSRSFWLNIRNEGEIEWYQIGNRILYAKADLDSFVKKNKVSIN